MLFLRKIFFYIFLIIYLIVCPLIILYAFGFIFKPGGTTKVTQTGLIYLATAPTGADVYLDRKQYDRKTPTIITGLLPGKYKIILHARGYRPWTHSIEVKVGKAAVLDKILLVPLKIAGDVKAEDDFRDIKFLPANGHLLLSKENTLGETYVFDCMREKIWPLVDKNSTFSEEALNNIISAGKDNSCLLITENKEKKKYLWVTIEEEKNSIKNITKLFPIEPTSVKWMPQSSQLFALQAGCINKIDAGNRAIYPEYLKKIKGFDIHESFIYALTENNTLLKIASDGGWAGKTIFNEPAIKDAVFGSSRAYDVKVCPRNCMIFVGEKGELLTNHLPYKFVDNGVLGHEFCAKDRKILIWTKDKIGVLDLRTERTGDVEFEIPPRLKWIYEKGIDIKQAFWAYDAAYIIFKDGDKVFLMESEWLDGPNVRDIVTVKTGTSVYYTEQTGNIYYLDAESGELKSVKIIPDKELIPLSFAETKIAKEIKEVINVGGI
ncbi:MAG: PEGA domain-containing protein [Candidatus Omnitrophica bacterium]|nr:PEGA domain-containing protein [Candidatus Omnitrophota bacterium]